MTKPNDDNKTCLKICLKYKVKKKYNQSFYELENVKYCSRECRTFLRWEGVYCPCCKKKLRTRPRTNNGIPKYLKVRGVVYQ